jgi:choline dehydrogenase
MKTPRNALTSSSLREGAFPVLVAPVWAAHWHGGDSVTTADYVIVGAGSAGCVLADRLSADQNTRVVLLEAGGAEPEPPAEVQVPALFLRTLGSGLDWGIPTAPQAGLNGRPVPYPLGKTLGGSSAINAQLWTVGHPADYDGWAAAGCTGWGYADLLPYLEKAETDRLRLAGLRYPSPVTADFINGCAMAGYAPAAERPDGYALARVNHSDGLRWSAADGYLGAARGRGNLTVQTGGLVRRVLFDGTRAVGVELETAEGRQEIGAAREVILAAGAVGSPRLLMLSGVGPAGHLAEHGIPVLVDLPRVGQGLSDHLVVPMAFVARGFRSPGIDTRPEEIEQYLKDRAGPLDSTICEALIFLRTRPELRAPDMEIALLLQPFDEHAVAVGHGVTLSVIPLRPVSTGSVTLASDDPHVAPVVDPGFLTDPAGTDLADAVAAVRKAQELAEPEVFAKWLGEPVLPDALSTDQTELANYVRRAGLSAFHPVSSCRMGADGGAVVDPRLRVRGTTGLRVVDGSALPGPVRGHPNASVIMLAERASELILGPD